MIRKLRNNTKFRTLSMAVASAMLGQLFFPSVAWALTGGPSQPEVESFEPVGTTEMVDLFTGDFTYNIPLLDVGGYPVNLSYHAGPTMDQEASWVGLGWNVNPGAITRNMRGLPDDFNGEDKVEKTFNMNPNWTVGLSLGAGFELFGLDFLTAGFSLGVKYNNYIGVGFEQGLNIGITAGKGADSGNTASLGLSLNSSAASGATVTPTISFSAKMEGNEESATNLGLSVGMPFNSRGGLQSMTLNASLTTTDKKKRKSVKGVESSRKTWAAKSQGASHGSTISFASPTFTPGQQMSMNNFGITGKIGLGGSVVGSDITVDIMAYYSRQDILQKELSNSAYGYLHAHLGQDDPKALHDFNREKDQPYIAGSTPNLPVSNYTYDLYNVSGQGVGGQYRPYRGDVGHVYDAKSLTLNNSGAFGGEIAGGNTFHFGVDGNYTNVTGVSKKWTTGNDVDEKLRFAGNTTGNLYEPAYLRQVGELSVEPLGDDFIDELQTDKVMDIQIRSFAPFIHGTTGKFRVGQAGNNEVTIPSNGIQRDQRVKRNQAVSHLTLEEARVYGLQPSLYNTPGTFLNDEAPTHHVAEITVLRPDGVRYVYGLPAYNKEQHEVTFNASGNTSSEATGLVDYTPGADNSANNSNGRDHFFTKVSTPPYAHAYMLTAVISPDYVDIDGVEGPSPGDRGSYTLFTYDSQTEDYGWRTPYEKNKANYNPGIRPLELDNKGNYIHGIKQVWYLNQIETRTHVADFVLNDVLNDPRKDSQGVPDENGGSVGGEQLRKLDRIDLYARPDFEENGTSAERVKSVHFRYSYSLCPGVPNNGDPTESGKLTLDTLFFTHGNSFKGKFSPYVFDYSSVNPEYQIKAYDRWGNFMPEDGVTGHVGFNPDGIHNAEYPYVDQRSGVADAYAGAWCLDRITLPSGGEINVTYEADDYAFVQDKRAGQMFKIVGVGNCDETPPTTPTFGSDLYNADKSPNLYLFVEVDGNLVSTDQQLRDRYFNEDMLDRLYFRASVHLKDGSKEPAYISGYAEVARDASGAPMVGLTSSGNHAYIKLRAAQVDGDGHCANNNDCGENCANPIARAAWQYGRIHASRLVNDLPEYSGDWEDIIDEMVGSSWISTLPELWNGPNGTLQGKGYGKKMVLNESWIRLQNPNGFKKGGGCRVARVTMTDQWDDMTTSGSANVYGQEYDYTMEFNGETWSSGVASWEPMLGGDENPHHRPITFSNEHLLVPDDKHYQETPFGESFFPSPSVGYSLVTVRNIKPTGYENDITHHASGRVEHGFYTARDFPTKTKRTPIQPLRHQTNPVFQLFTMLSMDFVTASQGYQVELNDMHGKPRSVSVFAEGAMDPRSKVEYFYHQEGNELNNTVQVVDKNTNANARVRDARVGVEIDAVADLRESWNQTISAGAAFNTAGFLIGIFPGAAITVWPSFAMEQTLFRSAVMTKVVNRFGILEKTVATEDGSTVQTENLAYDSETGEVLLTRTVNAYHDSIYSFTYPAHWAYDRMGPAYQNIGYVANMTTDNTGLITSNTDSYRPGDELALDGGVRAWVSSDGSDLFLIEEDGNAILDHNGEVKVLRSGHRNMQALPVGELTLRKNPLRESSPGAGDTDLRIETTAEMGQNVLAANAVEYDEEWQTDCIICIEGYKSEGDKYSETLLNLNSIVNPYRYGLRGNWRAVRGQAYIADRYQDVKPFFGDDYRTDIRKDGTFITHEQGPTSYDQTAFQPFWLAPGTDGDWTSDDSFWQFTTEADKFDRVGQEVQNVDALGRYAMALFGHGGQLPVAVADNARYTEVFFDGFEDPAFHPEEGKPCLNPHLPIYGTITTEESHTGLTSLQIDSGKTTYTQVLMTHEDCTPTVDAVPFRINSCDCIGRFSPETHHLTTSGDVKYVLSVWVKKAINDGSYPLDYPDVDVLITDNQALVTDVTTQRGAVVEGWQQLYTTFTLDHYASPGTPAALTFTFQAGDADTYFDDLRIHPFRSGLKSFVYHPNTLRVMAELDEENYATLYEYDDEGRLTRVKKETERGIVTLQESRTATYKGGS